MEDSFEGLKRWSPDAITNSWDSFEKAKLTDHRKKAGLGGRQGGLSSQTRFRAFRRLNGPVERGELPTSIARNRGNGTRKARILLQLARDGSWSAQRSFLINVHNLDMKLHHFLRHACFSLLLPLALAAHAAEDGAVQWDNTFSLVARDPATGAVGGAVSTARLAVGNRVLQAEFGVGAVASQANTNPMLARDALDRMRRAGTAREALDAALQADEKREERQLSVISAAGTQAAFTGSRPDDFKGHIIGKDVVVAGNILVGRETLEAMVAAFETTPGTLADRIMAGLEAGQKAGGDRRGKVSAAILVMNEAPGTNAYARNIDLRVDDSKEPVAQLRALFDAYKAAFRIK